MADDDAKKRKLASDKDEAKKRFYRKQREDAEAEVKKTGKKSDIFKSLERKGYVKSADTKSSSSGGYLTAKPNAVKTTSVDDSPVSRTVGGIVKKLQGGPAAKKPGTIPYNPASGAKPAKNAGDDVTTAVGKAITGGVKKLQRSKPGEIQYGGKKRESED